MGATNASVEAARLHLAALAVGLMGLAVPLGGCGGTGSTSASTGAAAARESVGGVDAVTIRDYKYRPAGLTVQVGTTVRFSNRDSTPHTATSKEAGVFESGPIEPGRTGTIKLEKAGTFSYYCVFHPFMRGTITVR